MRKSSMPSGDIFLSGVVMCEDNIACARMAMANPMVGTADRETVCYWMHSDSVSRIYSFSVLGRTCATTCLGKLLIQ